MIHRQISASEEADFGRRLQQALRNGLVVIELSPRRSIVVEIRGTRGVMPYVHLSGHIVFGPDTYSKCWAFAGEAAQRRLRNNLEGQF